VPPEPTIRFFLSLQNRSVSRGAGRRRERRLASCGPAAPAGLSSDILTLNAKKPTHFWMAFSMAALCSPQFQNSGVTGVQSGCAVNRRIEREEVRVRKNKVLDNKMRAVMLSEADARSESAESKHPYSNHDARAKPILRLHSGKHIRNALHWHHGEPRTTHV